MEPDQPIREDSEHAREGVANLFLAVKPLRGWHRVIPQRQLRDRRPRARRAGLVGECARLFSDLPAFLIGIRCPVDVLEQRERVRKNRPWGPVTSAN